MPTLPGSVDPGSSPGTPGADPTAVTTDMGGSCGCCDGSPCLTDCTSLLPPTLYLTPKGINTADCPCNAGWEWVEQINGKSAPCIYNNPVFTLPTDYWSFYPPYPADCLPCTRHGSNCYFWPDCAPSDPFWNLGNHFAPGDDPRWGPRKWWVAGALFGCFLFVNNVGTTVPFLTARYAVRGSFQLDLPDWMKALAIGRDLYVTNSPANNPYDAGYGATPNTLEDCATPDLICDGCSVQETGFAGPPVYCASNARLEITG